MHMKFLRKFVVLSGALIIAILCVAMVRIKLNEPITIIDHTEVPNYPQLVKQIELESSLRNFDKIQDAHVRIEVSESEISTVCIFLETTEALGNSEIDNIALFVSESLENIKEENIDIQYSIS